MIMKTKLVIILLATIYFSYLSEGKTFFVNSVTGNDTAAANDGSTSSKAFRTIQNAVNKASKGDKIIVEGKTGKIDKINYFECVTIPFGKDNIKIVGENKPILNGLYTKVEGYPGIGFLIKGNGIQVEGFIIKNYFNKNINEFGLYGGTAIFLDKSFYSNIINNEIDSCNWGIVLYDSELCKVNGNKINNCTSNNFEDYRNGGIGLMMWSRKSLQRDSIGTTKGNIITNSDYHGIFIGSKDNEVDADLSAIKNNVIISTKNSAGIGLYNIFGIMEITDNTFESNLSSVNIECNCLDTWFGNNNFRGVTGDYEVRTNKFYDGSLLYDLWKNNENKFNSNTAVIIGKKGEIKDIELHRYIWANERAASKAAGENASIEKF